MPAPSHIAVIDIGKTNAKVGLFDLATCAEGAVRSTPNEVVTTGLYPHFDTEALWAFILSALADLQAERGIDAISITAHGATAALIDADGDLALPVLDYEHTGPDTLLDDYAAVRPPFAQTGSPKLPGGLNIGAQLFWQSRSFPDRFEKTAAILTYPQYWSFRLSGVATSEVTTWGCHSDLWVPADNDFSELVDRMGWRQKMAPLRRAGDILGPVTPQVALATGLHPATPVYCGLHDSNASLLPHLWGSQPPFSVVSTGTWVVMLAVGARPVVLDEARDLLINVNALGSPVPSARFMGGRAFQLLVPDGKVAVTDDDRRHVLDTPVFFLPSWPDASGGPFPHSKGGWTCDAAGLSPGARIYAISNYLALMTATSLGLIGADGPVIVEGPFAANRHYLQMLETATGRTVMTSGGATGTSLGAAGLTVSDKSRIRPSPRPFLGEAVFGLQDYAARWTAMV